MTKVELSNMRTTIILKDELVQKAMELTKITEKTALIHAGLEALIAQYARQRLAALGGTDPKAKAGLRRKAS
jgi:Arc/MetJ family transcription regulator